MGYRTDDDAPFSIREIVLVGMFTAGALICGLIESRFPLPFPGVRLGLSNIFYLVALMLFGGAEAVCVASLRVLLIFVITGNAFAAGCSVGGLALSLPISIFLWKTFDHVLSVRAISVASAAAFNAGQLAAAAFMTGEPRIMIYYPVLLAIGIATGYLVGRAAESLCDRIERAF